MHIILEQVMQGAQLVEIATQLWTTIQHHSMLQHIQMELQQAEAALDQVRASSPSTVSSQRLAILDRIENLPHNKHVIRKRLKPWAETALQLTEDTQSAIVRLHWLLEWIIMAPDGPTSLTLVNITQRDVD